MNMNKSWQRNALASAIVAAAWGVAPTALAQETEIKIAKPLEEVTVVARQKSSAEDVIAERLEYDVVTDIISNEQIVRVGDPNVASALRRVPGLTLVDDKFIYVRGLGERYSSAQLNSALVPSPDLQRNVIPLDIFPAEVIESLAVQKVYSADMPANFGGGNVDIRTRALPNDLLVNVTVGTGWSSASTGKDGLTYNGGGDDSFGTDDGTRALPAEITQAIQTYRGDISVANIFQTLNKDGGFHTIPEAQAVNRQIASSLNRDIDITSKSNGPDKKIKGGVGYNFDLSEDWNLGFIAMGSYDNKVRNKDRINRSANNPGRIYSETQRTVDEVSLNGFGSIGLTYGLDHQIDYTHMFIRNTEDEASIKTGFNSNNAEIDSGNQYVTYDLRYEERELRTNQLRGEHKLVSSFNETIYELPFRWADDLSLEWFYSDSKATTDKPNEVSVEGMNAIDLNTHAVLSTRVEDLSTAAVFRFTDMADNVESYGWDLVLPLEGNSYRAELSGGYDGSRKDRSYLGTTVNIDTSNADPDALAGTPGEVFCCGRVEDRDNGFIASLGSAEAESYLAAQMLDAWYGKVDVTWNDTWRVSGGVRRESFKQASMPIDTLDFDNQLRVTNEELEDIVVSENKNYPSLSMTYMTQDFWAESFQFRLGYGGTTVRPDLREVAVVQYIDPLTNYRVVGNPNLQTSDLQNFDARGEWFFDNGNNFTLSLFYKDIDAPIETIRAAGSDDNVVLTFINAETAQIAGVEMEWLYDLQPVGAEGFFVSGNLTFSDSEIEITDTDIGLTNNKRSLTGHSSEVANIQLGFDSPDGYHTATLAYNYFGERIVFAARDGADDAYEKPFNSLDLNYAFYPLENLSLRLRLTNLLNEKREYEQDGVTIQEEIADRTLSFGVKWDL